MEPLRLSKFLANAGIAARRKAEELILAGKVRVNGILIKELGTKVDPEKDIIEYEGNAVTLKTDFSYVILNKPTGYLSTSEDTHSRKTVLDLLPDNIKIKRLYTVGRLDKESEGLLLLTDDGELANIMMHPRFEKQKEYEAHFRGEITDQNLKNLERGVDIELEEGKYHTKPCTLRLLKRDEKRTILKLILEEGKKRQIRRMGDSIGHRVTYLKRVRMGEVYLKDLMQGNFREATSDEKLYFDKLKSNVSMQKN